jgi:predicted metal-binding membrane protein
VTTASTDRRILVLSALLFGSGAAITIGWCSSMSTHGMAMPGGWTMSMVWMPMPGRTWPGAAASFLAMWVAMMVPMMIPSLTPRLLRYRQHVNGGRRGRLSAVLALTYFVPWVVLGAVAFVLGGSLAVIEMRHLALARVVPSAVGIVVLLAGLVQLSAWKASQLECCRSEIGPLRAGIGAAARHGLHLGFRCCCCCAPQTLILLVVGVMDLRAMAVVTVAITVERLAPAGERIARVIGVTVIGVGVVMTITSAVD